MTFHGLRHTYAAEKYRQFLEYIRRNPAEAMILPRVEKKAIKPLTDEQVSGLVASAGDDGFGTLFKVVVFTGLRFGKALGLTLDCKAVFRTLFLFQFRFNQQPQQDKRNRGIDNRLPVNHAC